MAEKQVRIDLVANDKASKVVDDLADEVKDLERLEPEIEVTADTDRAEAKLEELDDAAKALTRADHELLLRADVDKAKGALREFESSLDKTTDAARRTEKQVDDIGRAQGPRLAGNTVADLTGPLGEASGVASDLGGVFDGLGDSAESAWLKMGGSEAGGAAISGVLGGVGFAVAGVAAAWSYFRSQQKKAEEQQKELFEGHKKLMQAMDEGDIRKIGEQFLETYKTAADAATDAGIPLEELTKFVSGQAETIPSAERAWAEYETQLAAVTPLEEAQMTVAERAQVGRARAALEQRDIMAKARADYEGNTGAMNKQETAADRVGQALDDQAGDADTAATAQERLKRGVDRTKESMDKLQGSLDMERALLNFSEDFQTAHDKAVAGTELTSEEILDLKQDIIDVGTFAGLNPVQIKSLLDRVEAGDYMGVKTDVETLAAAQPVSINTQLLNPPIRAWADRLASDMRTALSGYNIFGMGGRYVPATPLSAAAMSVNVTQNVPRGYHGDLLSDARAVAKRSGGLYQRNRSR